MKNLHQKLTTKTAGFYNYNDEPFYF